MFDLETFEVPEVPEIPTVDEKALNLERNDLLAEYNKAVAEGDEGYIKYYQKEITKLDEKLQEAQYGRSAEYQNGELIGCTERRHSTKTTSLDDQMRKYTHDVENGGTYGYSSEYYENEFENAVESGHRLAAENALKHYDEKKLKEATK